MLGPEPRKGDGYQLVPVGMVAAVSTHVEIQPLIQSERRYFHQCVRVDVAGE